MCTYIWAIYHRGLKQTRDYNGRRRLGVGQNALDARVARMAEHLHNFANHSYFGGKKDSKKLEYVKTTLKQFVTEAKTVIIFVC